MGEVGLKAESPEIRVLASVEPRALSFQTGPSASARAHSVASLDPEQFHEASECDIPMHQLNKLTRCRSHPDNVSAALAWDDLTGMKLDAGIVISKRYHSIFEAAA